MNPAQETAIRKAFASREFEKGRRLWTQYAEGLRAAIEEGSATPAMMADAGRLLEWARLVVKCFRSHAQARLNRTYVAAAYAGAPAHASRTRASL
ncbi:MAG: hypothetical protein ABSF25_16640 [Bryobacteraceae bacterium]|jgi:hypothetical protein